MSDYARGFDYDGWQAQRERIERELDDLAEFHPLTTSNPAQPPTQPALDEDDGTNNERGAE